MSLKLITSDRRFAPLFWTQFFGALNDNYFKNALIILIAYKNIEVLGLNSASLVAFAGGIFILPFFLFSATSGQLADKVSKTSIIQAAKISEFVIMLLGALGLYIQNYSFLLLVLFLMGTQSSFFGPVKYGVIPQLIKKSELMSANAFIGAATFIAILIGTLVGGLSAASDNSTLLTTFGVLLISLIGIGTSLLVEKVDAVNKNLKIDWTFTRSTFEIIKITKQDRPIFKAVMGMSWFWFLGAAILSLIPNLSKDIFKSSEEVGTFFLASFTVGMAFGAFFSDKISKHRPELGVVPLAAFFMSIFLFDLSYVSYHFSTEQTELMSLGSFFKEEGSIRVIVDLFLISFCGGLYVIPQQTFIQDYAPAKILSRIIAGNNIWNALFMVLAAILIMILSAFSFSLSFSVLTIGALTLISSFILYYIHSQDTVRLWGQILGHLFYDLKINGRENIPLEGSVVLVSNHVSFIDWILIYAASPRSVRFVIDHTYYYSKGLKFWLDQAGLIPIAPKRESEEILNKAFKSMSKAMDDGGCLGLFPEGWLTRDGKMRKLQPGVSKIVREHKTPIVPIIIEGLWGSFFSHADKGPLKGIPSFKRRKITINILKPIHSEDYSLRELESLMHKNVRSLDE